MEEETKQNRKQELQHWGEVLEIPGRRRREAQGNSSSAPGVGDKSRSCQTALRLKPVNGRVPFLLHSTGESESKDQPDSVQEGLFQECKYCKISSLDAIFEDHLPWRNNLL